MKNFLLLFLIPLLISFQLNAATRTASVSGNWSSTATWGSNPAPVAGDIANINAGITVTVDVNSACATLNVYQAVNGTATLKFNSGTVLTVSGVVTIGTATGSQKGVIDMTSGGTLTLTGSGTPLTMDATNGTFTYGTGTVNYNSTSAQTVLNTTFNNLTISNSGQKTVSTSVIINGILSIEGSKLLTNTPTYGPAATLQYNSTTSFTTSTEWITPFTATGGVIINQGQVTLGADKVLNAPLTIHGTLVAGGKISP